MDLELEKLLREIVLLDGDETNPFDRGPDLYNAPDLGSMAVRAAAILGKGRDAIIAEAIRAHRASGRRGPLQRRKPRSR